MKKWSIERAAALAGSAAALCLLLAVTAPAAPPSLSLAATDTVVGQTVHATAQLSESPNASGEISFRVFGPGDSTCAGAGIAPAAAAVAGEGQYVSGEFTPPAAGAYYWSAHYSGDGENPPADSTCSAVSTVGKASPGLTGSASSATVGTVVRDEATLTGAFSATGEVTFSIFAPADVACVTPLATATKPVVGAGATSADFAPQQPGGFRWTAAYLGDANNEPVDLACGAANQTSVVGKAAPALNGEATSAATVGLPITDSVTLAGGFGASGQIVFRAYGPDDQTCATAAKYEEAVAVSGSGSYSPPGFAPPPGVYQWTAEYGGDPNNESVSLPCGSAKQASAVGTVPVTLTASATGGTVGSPVSATATIRNGAIPGGQITFKAFPPADANCSAAPVFSSTVAVAGNGSYRSAAFAPARVGTFRWTVAYSGDVNHAAAVAGCGTAASSISQAKPAIVGKVSRRLTVGARFRDTATLAGAYAPTGTITFRIYGPVAAGCSQPAFINTVAVSGNGTISSDPFVAKRPGRYSFVASYSGDARNQTASEPCDSPAQVARVRKRAPKVMPRAVLLGRKRISIRAHLGGGTTPTGVINFRLYRPGDTLCKGKPAFRGGRTVESNGTFSLAEYLATKPGIYRLEVGYSGDPRNRPYESACGAQSIRIGNSR